MTILFKFPLPNIEANLKFLVDRFFIILADYAGLGAAGNKAAVLELNQLLFKVFFKIRFRVVLVLLSRHSRRSDDRINREKGSTFVELL